MLSRSSEYAIRTLTYLAQQSGSGYFLVRDMAQTLGMPAPFLGKVLQPFVGRGLLESQRGRSGGFRLARSSSQITLFQIVDAHESLSGQTSCILGETVCDEEHACPLHSYWEGVWNSYIERLAQTTLAEVAEYSKGHSECVYPLPALPSKPAKSTQSSGGASPAASSGDRTSPR